MLAIPNLLVWLWRPDQAPSTNKMTRGTNRYPDELETHFRRILRDGQELSVLPEGSCCLETSCCCLVVTGV